MVQSSQPKARSMPALTRIRRPTEIHDRMKKVMLTARVAVLPVVIMASIWCLRRVLAKTRACTEAHKEASPASRLRSERCAMVDSVQWAEVVDGNLRSLQSDAN